MWGFGKIWKKNASQIMIFLPHFKMWGRKITTHFQRISHLNKNFCNTFYTSPIVSERGLLRKAELIRRPPAELGKLTFFFSPTLGMLSANNKWQKSLLMFLNLEQKIDSHICYGLAEKSFATLINWFISRIQALNGRKVRRS